MDLSEIDVDEIVKSEFQDYVIINVDVHRAQSQRGCPVKIEIMDFES